MYRERDREIGRVRLESTLLHSLDFKKTLLHPFIDPVHVELVDDVLGHD